MAARKNRRVGGEHAIHIGPDLNLFGFDAGADNGRREIRAAAAERRGDAVFRRSDEATHYDHAVLREARDGVLETPVSFTVDRRSLRVTMIGHDHLARIDM